MAVTDGVRAIAKAVVHVVLAPAGFLCYVARIRFFNPPLLNARIGHLAYEPDFYVKSGLIGWRARCVAILLSPRGAAVNPALLQYWRQHFVVITNPAIAALLRPLSWLKYLRPRYDSFTHVPSRHRNQAFMAVQRAYEARFGPQPLLKLDPHLRTRGRAELQRFGIPPDAWFVCLHVRETGAPRDMPAEYQVHLRNTGQSFRDADVTTYLTAADAIVERGGWVIRMGDPSMQKLPPRKGVVDYAHSEFRSDWMDVFLCAEARFFLGTTSGLFLIPLVFGIPCVLANVVPLADAPFTSRDRYILKHHFFEAEQRFADYSEICATELPEAYHGDSFKQHGIRIVDNTAAEILEVVSEALDGDAGARSGDRTEEEEGLQKAFTGALARTGRTATVARIGKAFLRQQKERLLRPC